MMRRQIAEGAYAVTNHIRAAVAEVSKGLAEFVPLRIKPDGSGTTTYMWRNAKGWAVELIVMCYTNKSRQMAVCCCLHRKGDSISCNLK